MKKLRLRRAVCSCVIAFIFVSASPNTAEAFVNNAGEYSSQEVHSMELELTRLNTTVMTLLPLS